MPTTTAISKLIQLILPPSIVWFDTRGKYSFKAFFLGTPLVQFSLSTVVAPTSEHHPELPAPYRAIWGANKA